MRIFNSVNKTKYTAAFLLLLAFSVVIIPYHAGGAFDSFVRSDFSSEGSSCFCYKNIIHESFIYLEKIEPFGSCEVLKKPHSQHRAVRQIKVLPNVNFAAEKYKSYKYAVTKAPHHMQVFKLLAQLIVIYIFLTDGKKRSLKLSYK